MAKNPKMCPNSCGNPILDPYALCGPCLRAALSQNLGDRLAKSLMYAHMSVEEMATFFEARRNTISGYLGNRAKPSQFYLKHWAERTGVPLQWLQTGTWPDQSDVADTSPAVTAENVVTPAERLSILAEQLGEIAQALEAESPAHALAAQDGTHSQDPAEPVQPEPGRLTETQLATWNYLVKHESDGGVHIESVARGLGIKVPAATERCRRLASIGYAKPLGKGHFRAIG